jgi:2-polyprenyl-3-methyl-5-hydroxy-6-metoxy-1,4-benzoquinol methylase
MNARANAIIDSFASVITPHSRILDIGAGKGLLAQAMMRRFDAQVTLVDVASYNQTNLPLSVCDSRRLAFADHSFDYALLSFVLHHCQSPAEILREALRVAHQVIVIENDVRGKWHSLLTRLIDSYPALRYGTPPCYFTKTRNEWLEWFAQFADVKILSEFSLEYNFFHNFTTLLQTTNSCNFPSAVGGR